MTAFIHYRDLVVGFMIVQGGQRDKFVCPLN